MVPELIKSFFVIVGLYLFLSENLFLSLRHASYALIDGASVIAGLYPYYMAIQHADPTAVVP